MRDGIAAVDDGDSELWMMIEAGCFGEEDYLLAKV